MTIPGNMPPIGPGSIGLNPFVDSIGIFPPYGGCSVYPIPPPPPIFPPIVIDDRIIPPTPQPVLQNVAVSASISPGQAIVPGAIITVALGSLNFSVGGATISGNSIILPVAGVYTVTANVNVTRDAAVGTNVVTLSVVGGVLGGGILDSETVSPSESTTLSGAILVQAPNAGAQISFQISNSAGGGTITIGSGTVGAKL